MNSFVLSSVFQIINALLIIAWVSLAIITLVKLRQQETICNTQSHLGPHHSWHPDPWRNRFLHREARRPSGITNKALGAFHSHLRN